ncbi:MAG: M67 family metallopeptidase [Vicinamibacterales bacterium]
MRSVRGARLPGTGPADRPHRGPLLLPSAVRGAVVAHARRDAPRECCGLLLGRGRRVTHAVAMRNAAGARARTRFRLDDRDHIAVRRILRDVSPRLEIVGVYHSHPAGPARPSPTDVAEAHYPDWVYLIVGLSPRVAIGAFAIRGGRARRVPIGRKGAGR